MKFSKGITVILTVASLLATCSRDKTAPAATQQAAAATNSAAPAAASPASTAEPPKPSGTGEPAGVTEKAPSELALDLAPSAPAGFKVTIGPKVIERGSPCLFTVTSAGALSSLSGATMGKKVFFNPDQSRKTWYGLAGVALESRLGSQTITLKGSDAGGRPVTFSAQFEIEARKTNIRVPPTTRRGRE
jgi:hypothetical protein